MHKSYEGQIIWIIGASSGIGKALAHELSSHGATLALSARRKEDLDILKDSLGERHKVCSLDVADYEEIKRSAEDILASFGRIDRVILLAAIYKPMALDSLDMEETRQLIRINLEGALNVVDTILPIFKKQQVKGQIALCGSVAGYIGLPAGQPYSATKAAIINLAESLYSECQDICDVKLINPGFVRSPLTDKNNFSMPMIIEPDRAAKEIAKGLLSNHFEIHFPRKFTFLVKFLRLLPYFLSLPITRRIKR